MGPPWGGRGIERAKYIKYGANGRKDEEQGDEAARASKNFDPAGALGQLTLSHQQFGLHIENIGKPFALWGAVDQ
jgi:hypothetical protein